MNILSRIIFSSIAVTVLSVSHISFASVPAYMLLPQHQNSTDTLNSIETPALSVTQTEEVTDASLNSEIKEMGETEYKEYRRLYAKGLKRAEILELKNNQLSQPVPVEWAVLCMQNTTLETFIQFAETPEQSLSFWMNTCEIPQTFAKIEEQKKSILTSHLRETYHYYGDLWVGEHIITALLNPEIWDENTNTLLGNQQGITHTIHDQSSPELTALGVQELIGAGVSSYAGSSWSRIQNLQNAASKLDGQIIHPGATLSVVNALAPFSYANGYKDGLVIKEGETETEIGGGVCQSVTTIFRAWQNAGLEVTSFKPHSKSIGYYGDIGLDATIYKGANTWSTTDLLLKNNTSNSILIKVVDSEPYQLILLYGTKDRNVSLEQYELSHSSFSQTAKWIRMVEYNNSGEWIPNSFSATQSR